MILSIINIIPSIFKNKYKSNDLNDSINNSEKKIINFNDLPEDILEYILDYYPIDGFHQNYDINNFLLYKFLFMNKKLSKLVINIYKKKNIYKILLI
jgi:hypothetical protein